MLLQAFDIMRKTFWSSLSFVSVANREHCPAYCQYRLNERMTRPWLNPHGYSGDSNAGPALGVPPARLVRAESAKAADSVS
jgi:hypothetical protein